jgi:DNA-directed RNA polymerase specialized sigma24 family protein
MDESAEARLLDAARRGSADAFGEIVRRWHGPVYDFCLAVTGEPTEAARLAASAFSRAVAALPRIRSERPGALVFHAAWQELDTAGWFATSGDDALPPGPRAAFPAVSRRRAAIVNLAMRHHLDADGLAEVLGITEGSAAIVLARVVQSLHQDLGPGAAAELAAHARGPASQPGETATRELRELVLAAWPERQPEAPVAAAPRRSSRRSRTVTALGLPLAALSAGLAALLLIPASPVALTRETGVPAAPVQHTPGGPARTVIVTVTIPASRTPTPATRTPRPPSPSPARTQAGGASTATPRPSSTPSPSAPAGSRTVAPSASPSTSPTQTPTITPTPTPTATPTPCEPRITLAGGDLSTKIAIPGSGQTSIDVFNSATCGEVAFSAGTSAAWLQVAPLTGVIGPFRWVTLVITASELPKEASAAAITVSGPSNTVTITVEYSP